MAHHAPHTHPSQRVIASARRSSGLRMPQRKVDNSGQLVCVLIFIGGLCALGWLTTLEGPTQIGAAVGLGCMLLLAAIGKGRAVQKHQPIWCLCTPVSGCFFVLAVVLALPFAIKTYCKALFSCSGGTKEASTPSTSASDQAKAVSAAYEAGRADAERAAAADVEKAKSAVVGQVPVVQGTIVEQQTEAV